MIGFSSLKYEMWKSTLSKFGTNIKYLLGGISSNYSIIIYKGERCEDYIIHIFRGLLSGTNSTFNIFIESTKHDWVTGTKVPSGKLIKIDT